MQLSATNARVPEDTSGYEIAARWEIFLRMRTRAWPRVVTLVFP